MNCANFKECISFTVFYWWSWGVEANRKNVNIVCRLPGVNSTRWRYLKRKLMIFNNICIEEGTLSKTNYIMAGQDEWVLPILTALNLGFCCIQLRRAVIAWDRALSVSRSSSSAIAWVSSDNVHLYSSASVKHRTINSFRDIVNLK